MNYAHVANTDEVPEEWDVQLAGQESNSDINDLEHLSHNSQADLVDDPQPCISNLDVIKAQSDPT